MTSEQFIKFREMIEREFSHDVTNHPKFCDLLVNNLSNWNRLEHMQKVVNSEPPYYGENILLEEVAGPSTHIPRATWNMPCKSSRNAEPS